MTRLHHALLATSALIIGATVAHAAANDWDIYNRVSAVACGGRPVLLQGSHTDVTLTGPCRYVRVAGEHNDIHVGVLAGATIEITGEHNDIWWRQVSRGPGPQLLDHAAHNSFHHEDE